MSGSGVACSCDVAVVGGGPAGAAVARLLALWGRDVVLLHRGDEPLRDLAVSLPPSVFKLFSRIGVLGAVDAAGFVRSTGNTVWWGDKEPRSQSFAEGMGYQVRHRDLDRVLRAAAEAAGARLVPGADVVEVGVDEDPVVSVYETGATRRTVRSRFVLDATGRRGVLACSRGLRVEESVKTIALIGSWRRGDGWRVPDDSHTLVESFVDGWAWSVPVDNETRYVTFMLDPRLSDTGTGSVADRYEAAMQRTTAFQRILEGAVRVEEPWGCDASGYHAKSVSGDRFLLVGDAASFVDPLSSFGVQKALGSAWLAALVANTVLSEPSMAEAARLLFEDHERGVYDTFRARAHGFFDAVAGDERHPFWTGRATAGEEAPGAFDVMADRGDITAPYRGEDAAAYSGEDTAAYPDEDASAYPGKAEIRTAFEKLKASPSIRLQAASDLRVVVAPVIGDRRIVMEEHLATPSVPAGLRYLGSVDARRLVEIADQYDQVPDLFDGYNDMCEPVSLPDFLGALSVLLAAGVLRNEATR